MKSTWAFQVFKKYNNELNQMMWANNASSKFAYKNLKKAKAKWTDTASDHLEIVIPKGEIGIGDLKHWSDSYKNFHNWTNLNGLLALSSNLETYIDTSVSLALESDPGVLFESPRSIDGVLMLKNGAKKNKYNDEVKKDITKGEWNGRRSAFLKTFGHVPQILDENISSLEKIRKMRNKVGHAFGRDIEKSRNHEVKEILPMSRLSNELLKKYQEVIYNSAQAIDQYLLKNHIGEYQFIAFYHRIYEGIKSKDSTVRVNTLKKRLGMSGDLYNKDFCKELVYYYENL